MSGSIFVNIEYISSGIAEIIAAIISHIATKSDPITDSSVSALIIPSIIIGIASTIVLIILGRFLAIAAISLPIIIIIRLIISGRLSINACIISIVASSITSIMSSILLKIAVIIALIILTIALSIFGSIFANVSVTL